MVHFLFILVIFSDIVFARITGKLSDRITAIFLVLAGMSFNLLPSLQFILLIYAFGAARGGEFNFINFMDSFMSNSGRKQHLYLKFNLVKSGEIVSANIVKLMWNEIR